MARYDLLNDSVRKTLGSLKNEMNGNTVSVNVSPVCNFLNLLYKYQLYTPTCEI